MREVVRGVIVLTNRSGAWLVASILVAGSPAIANTVVVPGTKFSTGINLSIGQANYYQQDNTPILNEEIVNFHYLDGDGSNTYASSIINTQPSIIVQSMVSASSFQTAPPTEFSAAAYGVAFAESTTSLDFSFDIISKYNEAVSLNVQSKAIFQTTDGSQGDGDGTSFANATFSIPGLTLAKSAYYGDGNGGKPLDGATLDFGGTFSAYTNVVYTGEITTQAEAYEGHGEFGQAYAYVDPTFQILGVDDPAEFQLVLSPGVGNTPISAVPETSTWAMMLLGFGGLGFLAYRKTRNGGASAVMLAA